MFTSYSDAACASGNYHVTTPDLTMWSDASVIPAIIDHYVALLRMTFIGMLASVIWRRKVLETVDGFYEAIEKCEDYELFLRIRRRHPVARHDKVVVACRWHDSNRSADPCFMLTWALLVLRTQRRYVRQDPTRLRAFRSGMRQGHTYHAGEMRTRLTSRGPIRLADWLFVLRNGW